MTERRCKTCLYDAVDPQSDPCKPCFDEDMALQGIDTSTSTFKPGAFAMKHFPRWKRNDDYAIDAALRTAPKGSIIFHTQPFDSEHPPIVELRGSGDILVRGKLVENDKELVDALRCFILAMRDRSKHDHPTGLVHRDMYDQVVKENAELQAKLAAHRHPGARTEEYDPDPDDNDWGHIGNST